MGSRSTIFGLRVIQLFVGFFRELYKRVDDLARTSEGRVNHFGSSNCFCSLTAFRWGKSEPKYGRSCLKIVYREVLGVDVQGFFHFGAEFG